MADEVKHSAILQAVDTSKLRLDVWSSSTTGIGNAGRDKTLTSVPLVELFTVEELAAAYRADHMIQKICDALPEDMTRQWLDVVVPEDEDASEALGKEHDRLCAREHFRDALRWERLAGGAAIFVGANDGSSDPSKPLNEEGIRSIDFLTTFAPDECRVLSWQGNPMKEHYGCPEFYSLTPRVVSVSGLSTMLQKVHASRVIHFPGVIGIRSQTMTGSAMMLGYGDSVITRAWDVVRKHAGILGSVSTLLADFSQAVIKIQGLARAIAGDRGDLIEKRLEMIDYSRSTVRMVAIDAENEEFVREPTPISGLPELLAQFNLQMAAAADMPISKLFGQGAAGMNATGEGDSRNWYDQVGARQTTNLDPRVKRLTRLLMLCKGSATKGKEAENWSHVYRPIWSEPESVQAKTRLDVATTDNLYFQMGALASGEIRNSRFMGDKWTMETQVEETPAETGADMALEPGVPRIDPETGEPVDVKAGATKPVGEVDENGFDAEGKPAPKAEAKPALPPKGKGPDGKPHPDLPGAKPVPGAAKTAPGGDLKAQDTALNGTQITAALEIVEKMCEGKISRQSAKGLLMGGLYIGDVEAESMLGPENFEQTPPEPTPGEVMGHELGKGGLDLKKQEIGIKAKSLKAKAFGKTKKADSKPKKVTKG